MFRASQDSTEVYDVRRKQENARLPPELPVSDTAQEQQDARSGRRQHIKPERRGKRNRQIYLLG